MQQNKQTYFTKEREREREKIKIYRAQNCKANQTKYEYLMKYFMLLPFYLKK